MFYLLFKFSFIIWIVPIIDSDNINLTRKGNEYKGFGVSFKVIKGVEGIKRSEWIQSPTRTNQEKQKQHTVNMRKFEFFRVVDDAYQLTSGGIVFGKMLDNDALSGEDKKIIVYSINPLWIF